MRVAIADDHPLITSSLKTTLLNTGYIDVCGTYASGAALIQGLDQMLPDILLLDYHLPDQNGAQLARYITYHYPSVKILALTGFEKPDLAKEMLESGCMGYLLKSSATTDMILKAIEQVHSGLLYIDRYVRDTYASSIRSKEGSKDEQKPKLTHRELEILKEIACERSSQEIADKLYISKRTVDTHRNSIMVKSGARNTAGMIKFAMELKLI